MEDETKQLERPFRVCYFGTYRRSYGRNQILINGLRANGVEVFECHQQLWQGIEDRVAQASGKWLSLRFLWRVLSAYWRLISKHRQTPPYDVMMLGYPGQFDAYLGRILSWWRRKPMVLDLYMSLYLIAAERGLLETAPVTGELIRRLERFGLNRCDMIICDTKGYQDYHCRTYGLAPNRFRFVPAGADDRLFYPREEEARPTVDRFRVIYHGTFLYSHGLETIIEAAELLKERPDIEFIFCGTGPEEEMIKSLATAKGLDNVTFIGWVDRTEMAAYLADADLCFGVFGTTQQSRMTIQNKIWEGLAVKRPVISGISPTVEESLTNGQDIYLIERANGEALANGICALKEDSKLRHQLGQHGYERFQKNHTLQALGQKLKEHLEALR